ncbi:hypothetical protein GWI33_011392 [Rhynchophorus ferrugineus]|uniref:Uncharacterized protein n=1 Tax=Rhynchophorus ferrugineus TaxID=354439 RepID=A0A834IWN2_RHYFE|nr:hypothetical protein GWI33_011392 [Rhynchophorus ferrugineus]
MSAPRFPLAQSDCDHNNEFSNLACSYCGKGFLEADRKSDDLKMTAGGDRTQENVTGLASVQLDTFTLPFDSFHQAMNPNLCRDLFLDDDSKSGRKSEKIIREILRKTFCDAVQVMMQREYIGLLPSRDRDPTVSFYYGRTLVQPDTNSAALINEIDSDDYRMETGPVRGFPSEFIYTKAKDIHHRHHDHRQILMTDFGRYRGEGTRRGGRNSPAHAAARRNGRGRRADGNAAPPPPPVPTLSGTLPMVAEPINFRRAKEPHPLWGGLLVAVLVANVALAKGGVAKFFLSHTSPELNGITLT